MQKKDERIKPNTQTQTAIVRDLTISDQLVYLNIPRRQFYCKSYQKYFTEELNFGAKWLLLKNKKDLKEDELEKLEAVLRQSKCLQKAYQFKEDFREIYKSTQEREKGKEKLEKWLREAPSIYSNAIKTICNHLDTICHNFLSRTTHGVMEGINNRAPRKIESGSNSNG